MLFRSKYLINVDVDVYLRENRTYEIEANSEEEAKLNYKLNGKIVDSIESDYLEEDHYNLEIEKAN